MAFLSGALLVFSLSGSVGAPHQKDPPVIAAEPLLRGMADAFAHKVPADYELIAQIQIQPELESGYVDAEKPALEIWHVVAGPDRKSS